MLLSHKKTHGDEQNWCIVLNPLRSELDRKRVARKISEVFALSYEEASDLVSNTPIILLDNLTRPVATKVKEFFRSAGAEILLTNDLLVKRKCYRTVWPEAPSLSFLHEWNKPAGKNHEDHQVLEAEEALNEIRSLQQEERRSHEPEPEAETQPESSPESGPFSAPPLSSSERAQLLDEVDRWMRQCMSAREESEHFREELQKHQRELADFRENLQKTEDELEKERRNFSMTQQDLERIQRELARFADAQQIPNPRIHELQQEMKELRAMLSAAEEKYEGLKEEYRDARKIFEERMLAMSQETESGRKRIEELSSLTQRLQREKDAQLQDFQSEKEVQFQNFQKEKEELLQNLDEEKDQHQKLKITHRHVQAGLDAKITDFNREIERWKKMASDTAEKLNFLEKAKQTLDRDLRLQGEQLTAWSEKYQSLSRKLDLAEAAHEEEKSLRMKGEERQKDLEASQMRLLQEVETRTREMVPWELKTRELEQAIVELREAYAQQEKMNQANLRHIETREKELDLARKQVRDLNAQLEHREVLQRRVQVLNQLAEKEARLKQLVKGQEKIESEMHEHEEEMKKILGEQETIEKEIIEAKQVQRHLLEQGKKEKDRFTAGKTGAKEARVGLQKPADS